jgi:SiaC family regulatory phosphoprotein
MEKFSFFLWLTLILKYEGMIYMKPLMRMQTDTTPYTSFDSKTKKFILSGRSIPDNAEEFYNPIIEWVEAFSRLLSDRAELILNLDFLNIASSKRLLYLLYKVKEMQVNGAKISVVWYFDPVDTDMLEIGKDYQSMLPELNFKFISHSEDSSFYNKILKVG